MFNEDMTIESFDPELSKAINDEIKRQEEHIELIASENYASPRVIEAQGSVLTNKYAEGYPGKRQLWWLRICGHSRTASY
mgnify:CR=1 FL=1